VQRTRGEGWTEGDSLDGGHQTYSHTTPIPHLAYSLTHSGEAEYGAVTARSCWVG